MLRRSVFSVLLVGLAAGAAHGQTAGMTSFQALVKDAAGDPVTGTLNLEFRMFDAATAGNLVDMNGDGFADDVPGLDVKQVNGVEATAGIMSTKFGPIAPSAFDGSARWLEVSVNGLPLSRIEMAAPSAVSSQVNRFGTGVSVMSVDASTGNLDLSPDGGGEVDVNAARLTLRTQTVSDADGSAAQAVLATMEMEPATGMIRSSGDLQLATIPGGFVTANAVKITTAALAEGSASGVERVLRIKPEGIVSDDDDIEITPGPFRRLKILTSTVADGNASAAGPVPSIDFDPSTGTISSSGDLQLAPALGSFVTATAMKILPSGFGAGGASAVTPTIVFKDGGIGVDKGDIDISPGPFGKMKLLSSTVAGGDGSAAALVNSIDFDPATGTISANGNLTLAATSGSVIVPGAGGIESTRLRISATAADGASSAAGLASAEFVLNGGTIELQVDGEIVDRWTPQGSVGSGLAANRISGSSFNTAAVGKYGITILGGGTAPTNDPILCPAPAPPCVDNAHHATDFWATIAGGNSNTAGLSATVSGGQGNDATGQESVISGGSANRAFGFGSVIVGGIVNEARGIWASVPGGFRNIASGNLSFVGGTRAVSRGGDHGCFVWADSQGVPADFVIGDSLNNLDALYSSASNQFIVRAGGGFWFGTAGATSTADSTRDDAIIPAGRLIQTTAGVNQACRDACADAACILLCEQAGAHLTTGGTWTNSSDRNSKENITRIDQLEILDRVLKMEITRWNYKSEPDSTRHLGPMAQDFRAAFGLGDSDKTIATIDADGVALAAIQGLHQIVTEKDARITSLEARVQTLEDSIQNMSSSPRANMLGVATPAFAVAGLVGLIALGRRGRKEVA